MSDTNNDILRTLLADKATDRPDPRFTAAVLYRLGARRRLRRHLLQAFLTMGIIGPLVILALSIINGVAAAPTDHSLISLVAAGTMTAVMLVACFSWQKAVATTSDSASGGH
jgi:predicted membrane channel-forming protein YqfA (hemolysin III family)